MSRWAQTLLVSAALAVFVPADAGAVGYVSGQPFVTGDPVVAGRFHTGGLVDLATGPDAVWANDGHGAFTAPASPPASAWSPLASADFDADGIDDLGTATGQTETRPPGDPGWQPPAPTAEVALGHGDGTFDAPVTLAPMPRPDEAELPPVMRVFAQPIDDGATADLLVVTRLPARLNLYRGHGDGTFGGPVSTRVPALNEWNNGLYPDFGDQFRALAIGDLNGDGHRDVALAGDWEANVQIMFGTGSGAFTVGPVVDGFVDGEVPSSAPVHCCRDGRFWDMTAGDFDGDGDLDLAVSQGAWYHTLRLLVNDGHGNFTDTPLPEAATENVDATDLDQDGRQDLLIDGPRWLRARPGGGFDPPHRVLCSGVAEDLRTMLPADVDGDGRRDFIATVDSGNTTTIQVLRADPDAPACDTGPDSPAFTDATALQVPGDQGPDGGQVCFAAQVEGWGLPFTASVSVSVNGAPTSETLPLDSSTRACRYFVPGSRLSWSIRATNAIGSGDTLRERRFLVGDWATAPPTLTLEEPQAAPSGQVTLRGTVTPTGPRSQYRFEVSASPSFTRSVVLPGTLDAANAGTATPVPLTATAHLDAGTYYARIRGSRAPQYSDPPQEWSSATRSFVVPAATTPSTPLAKADDRPIGPVSARPSSLEATRPSATCALVARTRRRVVRCHVKLPGAAPRTEVKVVLTQRGHRLAAATARVGSDHRATVLLRARHRIPPRRTLQLAVTANGHITRLRIRAL